MMPVPKRSAALSKPARTPRQTIYVTDGRRWWSFGQKDWAYFLTTPDAGDPPAPARYPERQLSTRPPSIVPDKDEPHGFRTASARHRVLHLARMHAQDWARERQQARDGDARGEAR